MAAQRPRVVREHERVIEFETTRLEGTLTLPPAAPGIVMFAHGSGSSRFSPRNRYVATVLQDQGLATLLFDLLSHEEEQVEMQGGRLRFDIEMLTRRLTAATHWIGLQTETRNLPIGYFGASTGAAAALAAAAAMPSRVAAVVSRGGRPDLAAGALGAVRAPTLLIVGDRDEVVLELNRHALAALGCREKQLVTVAGAEHLFEGPGELEQVARLAADWFTRWLAAKAAAPSVRNR